MFLSLPLPCVSLFISCLFLKEIMAQEKSEDLVLHTLGILFTFQKFSFVGDLRTWFVMPHSTPNLASPLAILSNSLASQFLDPIPKDLLFHYNSAAHSHGHTLNFVTTQNYLPLEINDTL